ncbi:Glucose/Sorbosone dehydrogenase [Candidatus Methylopumilus universalis]|uniref:PQQ-dependent sugar dehydrogenase n=1 Tax=Candidatus Methylopumilus universalis TaxID=2588536 RepID=UPI003BEEB80D
MKKKLVAYTFFVLVLSTYTSIMVKWQFSPYLFFVKDLKKNITLVTNPSFINTSDLTLEINNSKDQKFGSLVNLSKTKITESFIVNNFNFHWGKVKTKDLRKIGAAELRGENIWYVNQDDYHLINKLGLDNKIISNGGIKSIFSINNKSYVYIAYVDGVCATARLVDLASMKIALQLSCLPDAENADLNAVGGGWLKLSNNTVLLSTGTPTMVNVDHKINQTAQLDESLWGKILKLNLVNDKLMVEIFSKGHRNPQGIAQIGKDIFAVEHGPMGGDEINRIQKGNNYGWPLQSLGSQYDLESINKSYIKPIMTQAPLLSFVPSIGISDIDKCPQVYTDYYAPNDCLAVSSMRGKAIDFIVYKNGAVLFTEKMQFKDRIRKFFVRGNTIVAVTDLEGVIIGNLSKLH